VGKKWRCGGSRTSLAYAGIIVMGGGVVIIIFGMLTGHQPACPSGQGTYCLRYPLWIVYRAAVLGGFITLAGIIALGKGLEIETPW